MSEDRENNPLSRVQSKFPRRPPNLFPEKPPIRLHCLQVLHNPQPDLHVHVHPSAARSGVIDDISINASPVKSNFGLQVSLRTAKRVPRSAPILAAKAASLLHNDAAMHKLMLHARRARKSVPSLNAVSVEPSEPVAATVTSTVSPAGEFRPLMLISLAWWMPINGTNAPVSERHFSTAKRSPLAVIRILADSMCTNV